MLQKTELRQAKSALIVVFFLLAAYSTNVSAGYGDALPDSAILPSACLIATKVTEPLPGRHYLQAACSGFLWSSTELLTAAHCTEDLDLAEVRVYCPHSDRPIEIESVESSPLYDSETVAKDDSLRWKDVGVIRLKESVPSLPVEVTQNYAETLSLLTRSDQCAFFGYAHQLGAEIKSSVIAKGVRVSPQALQVSAAGLIRLDGYAHPAALVVPGDSGGPLACKQEGRWVIVGVTSARDFSYGSLFAGLYSHESLWSTLTRPKAADKDTLTQEHSRKAGALIGEAKTCWGDLKEGLADARLRELARVKLEALDRFADLINLDHLTKLYEECRVTYRQALPQFIGSIFRVKPFTQVKLTKHFSVGSELEVTRLLERVRSNLPMSTVDHFYNRFTLNEIRGDMAIGDLQILGPSDAFMCDGDFLCFAGTYKRVSVPIERLSVKPLQQKK